MPSPLAALLERLASVERQYQDLRAAEQAGLHVAEPLMAWAERERDRAVREVLLAAADLKDVQGAKDADDRTTDDSGDGR